MPQEILIVSETESLTQQVGNDVLVEQVVQTEVLEIPVTETLVEVLGSEVLTEQSFVHEILTGAEQGPPGASWPEPFALAARFGEIALNETAKAQARANLDLQNIDGGTFN